MSVHDRFWKHIEQCLLLRSSDPVESLVHAEYALMEVKAEPGYELEGAVANIHIGVGLFAFEAYDRAYTHLHTARTVFRQREENDLQWKVSLQWGEVMPEQWDRRAALAWFDNPPPAIRFTPDHIAELRALKARARFSAESGDGYKALELFHEALSIVEDHGERGDLGEVLSEIATIHEALEEPRRALEYFNRSRASFHLSPEHRLEEYEAIAHMARVHFRLGHPGKALGYAERAREVFAELGDKKRLADVLDLAGRILDSKGEGARAADRYLERVLILAGSDHQTGFVAPLLSRATLHQRLEEQYASSLCLEQSLQGVEQSEEIVLREETREKVEISRQELRTTQQATFHYKRFGSLREQASKSDRQQAVAELEARLDLQHARNENRRLQRELEQSAVHLSSIRMTHVAQHALFDEIRGVVEKIERSCNDETKPLAADLLRRIRDGARPGCNTQWMMDVIDTRHPGFVRNLVGRYPELTQTERLVCILSRLEMGVGDIANVMYTTSSNVANHRTRIRRKLQVPSTTRLLAFLETV